MIRYVALLRGVNVGGKNLIKMTELKACFEKRGFHDVATYIQSGNVLFTADKRNRAELTSEIEKLLAKTFKYQASIVLRSGKEMRSIVERAPPGFGREPAKYRYDVFFLKEPLSSAEAMKSVKTREGVDAAHGGKGVLYFSRLISRVTQSQINKLVTSPIFKSMTARNWNTTKKLADLLETSKRR